MRSRFKAIVVALCTLALAITPAFAAWGDDENDASSGAMIASDQTYEAVNGGKRINTFKLGDLYSYESLGNDANKPTLTLSASALQKAVKEKLLPQWSPVAASVFRDQAGQLVDLYGYHPDGGNMSKLGFDAYFNMNKGVNTYKDEKWSCYDLRSKLGQTYASHVGDPGWDQFIVSGVRQVNSLSAARNMVGQALYDAQNHKGLEASEFLDVDEGGGATRLEGLDDEDQTTGFANLVTSVNCKGASSDFDYVTFGIVFYDFEPVPVAAQNLKYITGEFTSTPSEKGDQTSTIKNEQQQEIVHSAMLGDSVTETTSTTLSGLASFKLSENIGANIGWSQTESESETEFWADDDFGVGSSTSTSSEGMSMGLNWGAAWEMAGALGAEVGHSKSVELSKAVETTISLPPHTYTTIEQKATSTTYTQTYQQPAILNYKVAIFAVSGDFYSGGDGGINPSSYDKQSLVIKFDTQDEVTPFYGCTATDDLFGRVVTNIDVPSYDISGDRTYSTHSTASGWNKSEDINWADVMSNAQSYYGADIANNVAKKNFFFESMGKLNVEQDKATSSAKEILPLYDLASVNTSKTNYVLYSNNTLDYDALAVQGYDKDGVPFYGFTSDLGEWLRCDNEGNVSNQGQANAGGLLEDDPVEVVEDRLVPKAGTTGGEMYFKWMPSSKKKPRTGEHPDGQDLATSNIASPIVTVKVVNLGLNNPKVTAEGSYTGYYGKPLNLNDVITYEVTDKDDKVIDMEASWESREPSSYGRINVNTSGYVTFSKPGTYKVRPYVVNNDNDKVYSDWITITATEHDFVHYDAKAPTDCTHGNADGWKEHYRCADCGKYFSEPSDSAEIPASDVIIEALGHDWGDWTVSDTPGKEQRVCKNRANHIEYRDVYTVEFNMNGHGIAPENQTFASDASASVAIPPEPTAAGYIFEGWFTDQDCTTPYDFGSIVRGDLTLYAKWSAAKYTVAVMAVGDVFEDADGELKTEPTTNGSINFSGPTDGVQEATEEGYTYYYKEVDYGSPVTLTVKPNESYGLKKIQAIPVKSDSSMGDPFTPNKTGAETYSFAMPDADVAVMASFAQVTVTYDGNAPEGETVSGVPQAEQIAYGSTPVNHNVTPTVSATSGTVYEFGGWFTDKDCTKPYLKTSAITQDTTLYAKWVKTGVVKHMVTYTLLYEPEGGDDSGTYSENYEVEHGSAAYDPTEDIYEVAGKDLTAAYELQKDAESGSCWFTTNTERVLADPFNFTTPINEDTYLYAKVVPRKYTVTYYNGTKKLGAQDVDYNTPIGTLGISEPTKDGYTFSGWVTESGAPWSLANNPVTSDLSLYASWPVNRFSVTFDANGHGTAPAKQTVEQGSQATDPGAIEAEGYTFGGWFTDKTCTAAYDFATSVEGNATLYAKWAVNTYTVAFDANGHGTAPAAQSVGHGKQATAPAALKADGYTFGGWFTDKACASAYDFKTPVTADIKLYAKWTAQAVAGAIDISKAKVTLAQTSFTYDGKAKKPSVKSVVLDGKTLKAGTDYSIAYAGNVKVGTATATVTGAGNYKGSASATFAITKPASVAAKTSIAKAKVTLSKKSLAYSGKAKKPAVKSVVLNGKKLIADADYTVAYKNNKKLGTATVTVKGKGNYKDTAKATFKIVLGKAKALTIGRAKSKAFEAGWAKVPGAKSYQVQWRAQGGKWKSAKVKSTDVTVKGMKAGGLYDLRVRAVAGKSKGAWSAQVHRWLVGQAGVKASSKKPGAVKATWKKTAKANAGYLVVVRYAKGGKVVAKQKVSAGKTSATVKGLVPGKRAWVQVRALHKAGGTTYSGMLASAKSAVKVAGKAVTLQAQPDQAGSSLRAATL